MLKISETFSLCGLTRLFKAASLQSCFACYVLARRHSFWINVSVFGGDHLGGNCRIDQYLQFQVFKDALPHKIPVLRTFCHDDIESGVDQNVQIHVNRLPDSLDVFPS